MPETRTKRPYRGDPLVNSLSGRIGLARRYRWPEERIADLRRQLDEARDARDVRALEDPAALDRAARLVRAALARKQAREQQRESAA